MAWTEEKNQRRCDLIDRQIDGVLTSEEGSELNQLQEELCKTHPRFTKEDFDQLWEIYHDLVRIRKKFESERL